nr:MAG TPA: hypothetical protein [Bacteriophage sp.]
MEFSKHIHQHLSKYRQKDYQILSNVASRKFYYQL